MFYSGEAVLTSTHNLCFTAKKKNNVYPCKPQFYSLKVGFKGVKIIQACFCDEFESDPPHPQKYLRMSNTPPQNSHSLPPPPQKSKFQYSKPPKIVLAYEAGKNQSNSLLRAVTALRHISWLV